MKDHYERIEEADNAIGYVFSPLCNQKNAGLTTPLLKQVDCKRCLAIIEKNKEMVEKPLCLSYVPTERRVRGVHGPNVCKGNEPYSCWRCKRDGLCKHENIFEKAILGGGVASGGEE